MRFDRAGYHTINYKKQYDCRTSYNTFVPTPLCDVELPPDEELYELLANAHRQIGLLEGMCRYIDNMANVTNLFIKKETVYNRGHYEQWVKFFCLYSHHRQRHQ